MNTFQIFVGLLVGDVSTKVTRTLTTVLPVYVLKDWEETADNQQEA